MVTRGEKEWVMPAREWAQRMGYGKSSACRPLRRSFRSGHGGQMFNRHPAHEIDDTAPMILAAVMRFCQKQ